jgi:hypothetical protein
LAAAECGRMAGRNVIPRPANGNGNAEWEEAWRLHRCGTETDGKNLPRIRGEQTDGGGAMKKMTENQNKGRSWALGLAAEEKWNGDLTGVDPDYYAEGFSVGQANLERRPRPETPLYDNMMKNKRAFFKNERVA